MAQLFEWDDEPLAPLVSTDEGDHIEGAVQLAIGPDARLRFARVNRWNQATEENVR